MNELKPCPCCGSTAVQRENKKGTLICIECENPVCGLRTGWFLTYAEAAEAWNKRAEYKVIVGLPACVADEIEEVSAIIARQAREINNREEQIAQLKMQIEAYQFEIADNRVIFRKARKMLKEGVKADMSEDPLGWAVYHNKVIAALEILKKGLEDK